MNGQTVKRIGGNDTILYNELNNTVKRFGKIYVPAVPIPTANLLGYWSYDYGIESDSTIILRNARYAPVDTIDIVGLDWDITNDSLGIPLKTAATLQWVGTCVVDTMFWGNVTKNSIYPTTVFPNVDYGHKTYFKVQAHRLNADSTELYPARIKDIAVYSIAKTGVDSSTLLSYFSVPGIALTGVIWVAKDGNDVTGNGTRALPYATLEKVRTVSANNDTIYVKTGIYTENNASFGGVYTTKPQTFIGLGNTEIRATGIYPIYAAAGLNLRNINVNGSGKTYAIRMVADAVNYNFNNCKLVGGDYVFYYITANNSILTATNCYIGGYSRYWGKMDYYENYFTPIGEAYALEMRNNKTYNLQWNDIKKYGNSFFNDNTAHTVNFKYNNTEALVKVIAGAAVTFNSRSNHYIKKTNNLIFSVSGSNASNYNFYNDVFDQNTYDTYSNYMNMVNINDLYITNCTFNTNGVYILQGVSTASKFYITGNSSDNTKDLQLSIRNVDSLTISNNVFHGNTCNLEIYNLTGFDANYGLISYNEIVSSSDSTQAVPIQIGKSGTGVNGNNSHYTTLGNLINQKYSHSGIFVDRNYDQLVTKNKVINASIGITFKGDGENFSSLATYNVLEGDLPKISGILAKGADSIFVYNNTGRMLNDANYGIDIIDNEDVSDYASEYCRIKNNIFYLGTDVILGVGDDSSPTLTSDYNVFYSTLSQPFTIGATPYNFSEWQALTLDEHSVFINPNFFSATQLWPIISFDGTNLGATYDDGLDISTVWPSGVVTKQQDATWQIGAYVQ
jgi:hypothetical protein